MFKNLKIVLFSLVLIGRVFMCIFSLDFLSNVKDGYLIIMNPKRYSEECMKEGWNYKFC